MFPLSDTIGTFGLLRDARLGSVLSRAEALALAPLPVDKFENSFALGADVPNWFVRALAEDRALARQIVAYPTADRRSSLVLSAFQFGDLQLRCVLPLGVPRVRQFLTDAAAHEAFTLLLRNESTGEILALSVPFDGMLSQQARDRLSQEHDWFDLAPAVQLTALSCARDFCATMLEGTRVTDLVTLLVANPSEDDMQRALGHHRSEDGTTNDPTALH